MIDISQWRASIGLWTCCQISYSTHSKETPNTESSNKIHGVTIIKKAKDLTFSLGIFVLLLLILSGDVELNPGPKRDITSILKETPTQYELFELLSDIRHKWYDIGISLQIDRNILDNLKNNDFAKLFAVIDNFLTTQPSSVTWATVISAIESPIVNDKNIADLIREYLSTDITSILKEIPAHENYFRNLPEISDKWYEFGLALQVHCNILNDLKDSQKSDIEKVDEVIKIWKDTKPSPVTWETFITALENPIIINKELAITLRHYLKFSVFYRVPSICNRVTKTIDPVANKMLLAKAMNEGYVTVKWTKFSVSGAPGTGKSSFLNLLYNEDPPDCHNSTPVIATKEARIISATVTVGDDCMWRKIDNDILLLVIAQGVKHSIHPHKPEVVKKPDISSEIKVINQPLDESFDHPTNNLKEMSGSNGSDPSPTAGHEQIVDESSLPKPSVTQEIIDILGFVGKSEELYKCHWIYGVDTGGQAAFIDIAPALLRYHSVNILTHKLTERLEDKAKFFYSFEGKLIDEPVEKQITNLQLIESMFRSVLSINYSVLPNNPIEHVQKPVHIVLGTFLDKMVESYESLQKKNTILSAALKKFRDITVIHHRAGNEIIFPINTIGRCNDEMKMATKIRKKICQYYIKEGIPIRWFLFQLELQRSSQSNIVSLSNCLKIGKTLQMSASDVIAALNFYHDLTIFLYFPKILPNVAFLHPQPLFNKLSDLISISFANAIDFLEEEGIPIYNYAAHEELKNEGTFKEDLLTSPNSHLSQAFYPEFTPQDFLNLMTSLFIMASLPEKGKYFLPTVLATTSSTDYKSIPLPFKEYVDPLILSWDMKPLPRGVFPELVVNLLHRTELPRFQLKLPTDLTPRYRNVITLQTDSGDVLLVDGIYWIAVYYSGFSTECFTLRYIIYTGINEVISKFQYMANVKSVNEYFYCTRSNCPKKDSEHFCRLSEDKVKCICQDSSQTTNTDKSRQLPWFTGNVVEGGVHVSTLPDHLLYQQPTHEELITHARTAEWNQLGVKLGLDSVDLDGCHDCTSMYRLWIMQKGREATRRSLLDALRAIRQNDAADAYEDFLKTMISGVQNTEQTIRDNTSQNEAEQRE